MCVLDVFYKVCFMRLCTGLISGYAMQMIPDCRDLFHDDDYCKTIKHDPFFVILFYGRFIKMICLLFNPRVMLS